MFSFRHKAFGAHKAKQTEACLKSPKWNRPSLAIQGVSLRPKPTATPARTPISPYSQSQPSKGDPTEAEGNRPCSYAPVRLRTVGCGILLLAACLLNGCGGTPRPDDMPPLQPCTLTIMQDDKPLAGALVMLFSTDPAFKWSIGRETDAQGNAVLMTHGQYPGVPVGDYKVTVEKTERGSGGGQVRQTGEGEVAAGPVEIFTLVEKQYTEVTSTPLAVTVKKGKNAERLKVGKAVREKLNIVVR